MASEDQGAADGKVREPLRKYHLRPKPPPAHLATNDSDVEISDLEEPHDCYGRTQRLQSSKGQRRSDAFAQVARQTFGLGTKPLACHSLQPKGVSAHGLPSFQVNLHALQSHNLLLVVEYASFFIPVSHPIWQYIKNRISSKFFNWLSPAHCLPCVHNCSAVQIHAYRVICIAECRRSSF